MTIAKNNIEQQKLEEAFIEQMDNIYYPGYTEKEGVTHPERVQWELKEFQAMFSTKK